MLSCLHYHLHVFPSPQRPLLHEAKFQAKLFVLYFLFLSWSGFGSVLLGQLGLENRKWLGLCGSGTNVIPLLSESSWKLVSCLFKCSLLLVCYEAGAIMSTSFSSHFRLPKVKPFASLKGYFSSQSLFLPGGVPIIVSHYVCMIIVTSIVEIDRKIILWIILNGLILFCSVCFLPHIWK